MKVGDLHKARERSSVGNSPDDILADQLAKARKTYAFHKGKYDDMTLLGFRAAQQERAFSAYKAQQEVLLRVRG